MPLPASPHARLHALARLLTCDAPAPGTLAVGVSSWGAERVELSVRPLGPHDLVDELAGYRAPASWVAFGILAAATAYPVDDLAIPTADLGPTGRAVNVCHLVDRDGRAVSRVEPCTPDAGPALEPQGEGRVPDACRRVLGLRTDPAEESTGLYWVLELFERVLQTALAADLGDPPGRSDLVPLVPSAADRGLPWAILRRQCALGQRAVAGISPVAADWMDDGMFAREAIGWFPSITELLDDLDGLLGPDDFSWLCAQAAQLVRSPCP
jgi:hypothetical protein